MFLVLQFIDSYKKIHIVAGFVVLYNSSNLEVMDVLTSVVLSHFHIVSMLLSSKSILPLFCKKRL